MKRVVAAVLLASLSIGMTAKAEIVAKSGTFNGITVQYKVVLPNGYDPAKSYPLILAFPPGEQSMEMVDGMMSAIWQKQAEERGEIVVQPAAPNGEFFYAGGAKIFPAFIDKLLADYKVQKNVMQVAGVSNGGLSAFYVASMYPQYFRTVTGFPGFLQDSGKIAALAKMCVHMFAGEMDPTWANETKAQAAKFQAAGHEVSFSIEKGQGHFMRTLTGDGAARIFDQLDQDRRGDCSH